MEKTRKGDVVCRYGGEEFVVLLLNTLIPDAFQRAEEWRLACENMTIKHEGKTIRVTLSLGVVTHFSAKRINSEQLLNMADQAMYLAKNSGRNRTVTLGEKSDNTTSTS